MDDLGLGYLKIGQSSSSISGGEAQRIKLVKELGKIKLDKEILYLLDEPTTGLHLADIQKLLHSINRIVDKGNTVIVIEHNMDVVKNADYIIVLHDGAIVEQGTHEQLLALEGSYADLYERQKLEESLDLTE